MTVTHRPDLTVSASVSDRTLRIGDSLTLSATVANKGESDSAATTLRYYRSTDATITTSDTELGTDAVGVIASYGTSDQSIDLTAPSTTGAHYYGACVDSVTDEWDTTNNCYSSVRVTVSPNLEIETRRWTTRARRRGRHSRCRPR